MPDALPPDRQRPHPARFGPDRAGFAEAMAAHDAAEAAGHPGYLDPRSGLFVMTAQSLWARGSCCDAGCRHCPYLPR